MRVCDYLTNGLMNSNNGILRMCGCLMQRTCLSAATTFARRLATFIVAPGAGLVCSEHRFTNPALLRDDAARSFLLFQSESTELGPLAVLIAKRDRAPILYLAMNPATFIRRTFLIRSLPFPVFNFRRNMSTPRILPGQSFISPRRPR